MARYTQVFDLTASLETHMPSWPTAPLPTFEPIASVGRDGYGMERISCLSHCGTHIDAPSHFVEGGATIDEIAPDRFVGSMEVLDLRADVNGPVLGAEMIERHWPKNGTPDFLFLETGWSRRRAFTRKYLYDFPVIDEAAAQLLVTRRVRAVGIDTMSIDPAASTQFAAHHILLGGGLLNVENLDGLDQLVEGVRYTVLAAPLKIRGGSGGMCRVLAFREGERFTAPSYRASARAAPRARPSPKAKHRGSRR